MDEKEILKLFRKYFQEGIKYHNQPHKIYFEIDNDDDYIKIKKWYGNGKLIGEIDMYGHSDFDDEIGSYFIPVSTCPVCGTSHSGYGFDECDECHNKIDEWREIR